MGSIFLALLLQVASPLRAEGAKLVDRDGKDVRLQGVSFGDVSTGEASPERIEFLARTWKPNVVRLPVLPAAWKKAPEAAEKLLDSALAACAGQGLHAVVAWQASGNPRTGKAWKDGDATMESARAFWKRVAPKHRPGVLFEVYAEPREVSWKDLKPLLAELVGIVRAAAPEALVLVPGTDAGYDLRGFAADPMEGANLALAWRVLPFRGTQWDPVLGEARKKAPVFATEWGFDLNGDFNTRGTTESFALPLANFMEGAGIHWTASAWSAQAATPLLAAGEAGGTSFGDFVRGWLGGTRPKARPMLKEANDWVFWARKLDLRALGESKVDVCVVDPAVEGRELTRAEVEGLKWSPGGLKTVLAVLPIGEISEDRPHWKKEWAAAKPDWLGPAERTGRMKVRYWDERWQKTITDALDRILEQGFDGVVIEGLDAWSYWQEKDKDLRCRPRMVDWVAKVSARGKVKNKAFAILPREGEDLLAEAAFAGAVDGMIRTDLYFRRGGPVRSADVSDSQEALDKLTAAGKKVLLLEFPPDAAAVDWLYERCAAKGYVPYAGVRDLDRLVTHPAHLPD